MTSHAAVRDQSAMVSGLFFRLLPVQVLIVAMGSVNSIVDGAIAGRFIAPATVGVIGLYFTMVRILEAVGAVLLGGTAVLCGRYMGSGELGKTRGLFSLNMTVTFAIGAVLTAVSLLAPERLAALLGASEELKPELSAYTVGYAVGIVPQLLAQQLASFLQLERQSTRSYIGITAMILVNVLLDILFVVVWDMSAGGLALATSISNWAYFLILLSYYFTGKAQIRYDRRKIAWRELPRLLKIGFPGALLVFALAARNLVINRLLLHYGGADGLSAMSAFNMISGLIMAVALGTGAVIRMLVSVYIGEEDRGAILALLRVVFTKMMLVNALLAVAVLVFAPQLSGLYFPDPAAEVFRLSTQLFRIYGACIPLVLTCVAFSSYFQASGHNLFVNVLSIFDGFLGIVLPALLLAPALGATGVWIAHAIGLVITALLSPLYSLLRCRRWPETIEEWLLFPPSFGAGERLVFALHDMEEVTQTAEKVQAFCSAHEMGTRSSHYAALCLEEMAGNVVQHGFTADRKPHLVDICVVLSDNEVKLRMKDDCRPFDPKERAELVAPGDPVANIGIRMVFRLADEVVYQNLLGLNVLTIRLSKK